MSSGTAIAYRRQRVMAIGSLVAVILVLVWLIFSADHSRQTHRARPETATSTVSSASVPAGQTRGIVLL